ncbi:hypothetical protein [Paenibacillus sp. BJ-4]|uniref:hypothetical protein n=1 Tax=Paenibacillus sp. BJ-4 TaxID=2878097 RepID=UPI001CEFB841|nr:hypothetical protein [Paenibacillus sp. BJ-4]
MKSNQKNRNQAYLRHHRKRVIQRKKRLSAHRGWVVKFDGVFSKGKIHCSCWMCSRKTKRLGYPKSELSRIANWQEQLLDYDF